MTNTALTFQQTLSTLCNRILVTADFKLFRSRTTSYQTSGLHKLPSNILLHLSWEMFKKSYFLLRSSLIF